MTEPTQEQKAERIAERLLGWTFHSQTHPTDRSRWSSGLEPWEVGELDWRFLGPVLVELYRRGWQLEDDGTDEDPPTGFWMFCYRGNHRAEASTEWVDPEQAILATAWIECGEEKS